MYSLERTPIPNRFGFLVPESFITERSTHLGRDGAGAGRSCWVVLTH
jgi:hypothetical protein